MSNGSAVRYPSPGLCRVALHSDAARVDLSLPAGVPIAELLPPIVDLLAARGEAPRMVAGAPYRLSRLGAGALDSAKTLAQQDIRDGAVLLLSRTIDEVPDPRFDDPAEQVSATIRAISRPWSPTAARCTAGLSAAALAAVAGFVAVPGGPGAPNALLAAAAAGTATGLAIHRRGANPILVGMCGVAVLAVAAALAAVLYPASPQRIAGLVAAVSIGLLHGAARLSMMLAGLAPRRIDRAAHTHRLLTGLVAAFAATAALGALGGLAAVQASGSPRFGGVAVAAVTGAALLLRARSHTDRPQIAALVLGGIAALVGSLVSAAAIVPHNSLWLAGAAAAAAGTALHLGDRPLLSPVIRRAVELLEYPVLIAVAPLTCWICGCYGAARGLNLT